MLLLVLLLGNSPENYAAQSKREASEAPTGTLQKMIVENGSVTMSLDLNGLNGSDALITTPTTLRFAAAINSFFPILVFDDLLRGPEPGSIALVPQDRAVPAFPPVLAASLKQLVVEKLPSDAAFDLAVRDGKTGFTFFNIEGHQYRLRSQGTISTNHRRKPARFTRVCQRAGPARGRWRNGRQNLRRRRDAAGRDPDNRQRRSPISDHATNARRS